MCLRRGAHRGGRLARTLRVGLVVLLAGMLAFATSLAQAATLNLAPDGVVASTGWSANTGTITSALAASDGDSTYATTSGTSPLTVSFADPSAAGTISKVTLRVVAKGYKSSGTPSASIQLGMALNASTTYASASSVSSSYQTFEQELSTPPGGGSWTWADVQSLQGIVVGSFSNASSLRVTQMEIVVTYTASTSNTVTFSAHTSGQPTAADVAPSQEVVVNRFSLRRTVGDTSGPVINTLTINNSKTSPSTNVSGVYVYRDADNDGAVSAGDTKLNATAATFSGADATVTVNEAVTDAAQQYLVTYVVASGATNAATMDAKITAATTTNIATVSGLSLPATPTVFTVRVPTLTVSNADHIPASIRYTKSLATGVLIDNIKLVASDGSVKVNKITVHRPDTLSASAVSAVKLYLDDGNETFDPAADSLLGSAVFGSGANALFSGLSVNVATGTHADVWITYDVAAACEHSEALGSEVVFGGIGVDTPATIATFSTLRSALSGEGVLIDNELPLAANCVMTQPADGATLTAAPGTTYNITGTAADSLSGVASVKVSVRRVADDTYWDFDGAWTGSRVWTAATATSAGYATWDPEFTVPEADAETFEVSALFLDAAGNELMTTSSLLVDNVKPTLQSLVPVDATTLDAIFSETVSLENAAGFTVSGGISVSSAVLQADGRTVRLTTTSQTADVLYTLTVAAGTVEDGLGNANDVQSSDFYSADSSFDVTPPDIPVISALTSGTTEPTIATVEWAAPSGDPVGYTVLRAMNPAGPFVPIGSTTSLSFDDESGVPGQEYYYAVKAYDAAGNYSAQSDTAGPVSSAWEPDSPHGVYSSSTGLCKMCHSVHDAADAGILMRQTGNTAGELSVCLTCHDGTLAEDNVESGENSFDPAFPSGHSVEEAAADQDLTDVCTSCHSPHLDPSSRDALPAQTVNGVAISEAGNDWCLACHNAAADWYEPGGYDALLLAPSRNATGYPTVGTFPGYLDDANNPHADATTTAAPYPAGDCRYCHASHRAENEFDGLVSTFVSDDFTLCFDCHDGTTTGYNIKQYYPSTAGGGASQTEATRLGHKIETGSATLAAGSALPCYDCHNPHGSATPNGLLVITQTSADTTIAVGDSSGELDLTDASGVREFCFTCHTTCGSSSGNTDAYGWNGSAYAVVSAGAEVEGIDRTVRDEALGVGLKVPELSGHYRDDSASCLTCHGTMTADSGVNVHNPGSGVSAGGMDCYLCHSTYSAMDSSTDSYHHVMDAANPDVAPGATSTYPTSPTALACVSCHTDHNYFTNKSTNLRTSIDDNTGTAASTDYTSSGSYGICVSCHDVAQTKSTAQKVGGSEVTPVISGSAYAGTAHDYAVNSAAKVGYDDGSAFQANCTKCHTDSAGTSAWFQTGTYKIGTHTSAESRIAAALGAAGSPTEENLCFACHTGSTLSDGYGVKTMSARSQTVSLLFGSSYANTTSPWSIKKHAVGTYSGIHESDETQAEISANKHVECEDCHDAHATGNGVSGSTIHASGTSTITAGSPLWGASGIQVTTWPSFSGTTGSYSVISTATAEYQVCFKCHSGANTNVTSWGGTTDATRWTNVALEFNPSNQSYHPVAAPLGSTKALNADWMDTGWKAVGTQTMYCSDCHGPRSADSAAVGPHGSSVPHMLKGYWPLTSTGAAYTINGLAAGTQTGILCDNCHNGFSNNRAHAQSGGSHQSAACYRCHTVIPHGSALGRLIADANSSMPARYAYQGVKTNVFVSNYSVNYSFMSKNNCTVTTASGCGSHTQYNGTDTGW